MWLRGHQIDEASAVEALQSLLHQQEEHREAKKAKAKSKKAKSNKQNFWGHERGAEATHSEHNSKGKHKKEKLN